MKRKQKIILIGSSVLGLVLTVVVLLGVSRIGQERAIAPTAPESKPRALEGSPVPACRLSFNVVLPSPTLIPTPIPTVTPTPRATPLATPLPTSSPSPAIIGDFVWNDANKNGIQDAGEAGVSGVTITLYNNQGAVVQTNTSNTYGAYWFTVSAGTYSIGITLPANYTFTLANQGANDGLDSDTNPTSGRTDLFTVTPGQSDLTRDAGLHLIQPTPTPTASPTAQCLNIKIYTVSNSQWTLVPNLSTIKSGDSIYFAVLGSTTSGSFDKARFRINGLPVTWVESTLKNPSGEYYYQYTVPSGITTISAEAEIHHVSLGWQ